MTQPNPGASLSSNRTAPSIHVFAVLTWLAIFPLVAIGITVMAPFTESWDPLLRVFVLTTIVVPLSVYWVVPWFVRIYNRYLGADKRQ